MSDTDALKAVQEFADAWRDSVDSSATPTLLFLAHDLRGVRLTEPQLRAVLDRAAPTKGAGESAQADREAPCKPVDVGTGMPATTHLEAFGQSLRDAFGAMPYHVGSSVHGKAWRDVDVRIMLDDERFDALFPGYAAYRQRDAWWSLVCSAISELGKQRTGLPIDFQVQRTSYANEKFPGVRNPLFVGHAEEDHQPAMKETSRA